VINAIFVEIFKLKLSVVKNLFFTFLTLFSAVVFAQNKPFALGQIEQIQSSQLGETRTLNIYLPENYKPNDTTKFPVVYLLDGSADEDFIHVVGLYHFNSFTWINRAPRSIIVGIANVDRKRDFTSPTTIPADSARCATCGGSEKFINFIEKDLQPYIEKKYRTNTSKTIIGQSLGGLLATEILFKKPELFNKYVIISPSLWWDDSSVLNLPLNIKKNTSVYIATGKEGLAPTEKPHVMEVDANLLADKLIKAQNDKLKVSFDYLPKEDHATIGHQAIYNALQFLFPVKISK
jgi:predicted alpha/beta superfamily hydrolase